MRLFVKRPGRDWLQLRLDDKHLQAVIDRTARAFHDPSRLATPPIPDHLLQRKAA